MLNEVWKKSDDINDRCYDNLFLSVRCYSNVMDIFENLKKKSKLNFFFDTVRDICKSEISHAKNGFIKRNWKTKNIDLRQKLF